MPRVDVYEEKNEIVVKAELPGLDKNNIDVHVEENVLTIKAEKKKTEEVDTDDYYRSELSYGMVQRMVALPAEVVAGKAKATFKDGLLEVRMRKSAQAAPKATRINVG